MDEHTKLRNERIDAITNSMIPTFLKVVEKIVRDQNIYGKGGVIISYRKWWNPLRLVFGSVKIKAVTSKRLSA